MGSSTKHHIQPFSQIFFSIIMMRFIYVAVHINSSFHFIDDQYSIVPCHDFVKLTFLAEHRMLDSGLLFNRPQEKSKYRNLLLTVLVEVHKHTSRGYLRGSRQGADRESGKTWSTCLQQRPQVECCGYPKLGTDWSVQAKKSRVLINSMGFFI